MNKNFVPMIWADIRSVVKKLNSELSDIIDEINPTKSFKIYRATYSFGSEYVKDGRLYLPNEDGTLTLLSDSKVPSQIQDDLSYNLGSNPVSLILNKSAELYMKLPNRSEAIPFSLISAGKLFSTSIVLEGNHAIHHPAFLWNINAGAKTLFMLPKISKEKNFRRLQKHLGFNTPAPNNIFQHVDLFKNMYEKGGLGEWNLEVIFFSKKWFENLDKTKYLKFKSYMQNTLHKSLAFWSSQYVWDTYFSLINNLSGIRPNPYVYDTVKHILLLSMGILPGIAPSIDDSAAPISNIQNAFFNIYKIDYYLPIIMQPTFFDPYSSSKPIYYSLHCPNSMELSPRSAENVSTIIELYEIKNLLNLYLRKLSSKDLNISNTLLSDIPNLVEFDFFHSSPNNYRDINSCEELFKEDESFSRLLFENKMIKKSSYDHPVISTLVRGCIRIRRKDK